jgi:hypothetical protein
MDTAPASKTEVMLRTKGVRIGCVVSLLCLAIAVGAMGALHVVQRGLDPLREPVSFYVHGHGGHLLSVALGSFGAAAVILAFAAAIPARARGSLAVFGTGMLITAIAPSDPWFPWEARPSATGMVHAATAVIAPLFLLDAMFASVPRRNRVGSVVMRGLAAGYFAGVGGAGVSLLAGLVLDIAPPWVGFAERVLAFSAVGWLATLAIDGSRAVRDTSTTGRSFANPAETPAP